MLVFFITLYVILTYLYGGYHNYTMVIRGCEFINQMDKWDWELMDKWFKENRFESYPLRCDYGSGSLIPTTKKDAKETLFYTGVSRFIWSPLYTLYIPITLTGFWFKKLASKL